MTEEDKELAKCRLEKALDAKETAILLLQNNHYNRAMNSVYYSLFYAMKALLATKHLDSSKHSGVISLFHKEFVKTGIIQKEFGKVIEDLFHQRVKGDYEDFYQVTGKDVKEALVNSEKFLKEVDLALKKILSS